MTSFPVSEHENWQENWDQEAYAKTLTLDNFKVVAC